MFTKNWYKVIAGSMLYEFDSTRVKFTNLKGVSTTMRNNVADSIKLGYNIQDYSVPSLYYLCKYLSSKGGVVLGSGTTSPTIDDYTLSGEVFHKFNFTADVTKECDEDGVTFTAIYTITNTGDSDFTIGEIGLITTLTGSTGSGDESYRGLLERTVLDTPVTIQAGGIGQVTYSIRVNYPT